jgi:hypothetical protein
LHGHSVRQSFCGASDAGTTVTRSNVGRAQPCHAARPFFGYRDRTVNVAFEYAYLRTQELVGRRAGSDAIGEHTRVREAPPLTQTPRADSAESVDSISALAGAWRQPDREQQIHDLATAARRGWGRHPAGKNEAVLPRWIPAHAIAAQTSRRRFLVLPAKFREQFVVQRFFGIPRRSDMRPSVGNFAALPIQHRVAA